MRFDEFQTKAQEIDKRAHALRLSVREEARRLSKEAGLDPDLLGIHPHNAMRSYDAGHPWPGVDYSKVRRILWLVNEKQWEASRLAERITGRLYARVTWGS